MNRRFSLVAAVTVTLAGAGRPALAQFLPPPPYIFTWDDVLGVSPKNSRVPEAYRYAFRGNLRTGDGRPIAHFPASQIELCFVACHEHTTRPSDYIPADADTDDEGNVVWSVNLGFGGADPCPVNVLIQNVIHETLAGHRGLADPDLDGGVRSPDEDGDGFISLPDLVLFQCEFVHCQAPQPRRDWRGDLGPNFDGQTSLTDLTCFQVHFVAQ